MKYKKHFQDVHQKQLEMLDKFSHHVRVNKIDEKYREQYLDTIRQLVTEQVRTQTYITRLASERDGLMGEHRQHGSGGGGGQHRQAAGEGQDPRGEDLQAPVRVPRLRGSGSRAEIL